MIHKMLLLITFFTSAFALCAQPSDAATGLWLTAEGDSHIEVYRDGAEFKGKIVWLKNPKDDNGRPVTGENGNEILNMIIMTRFEYQDGAYVNGNVYDPESGKTYYGSMELGGKDVLKLRGSLDKTGWLGRTETWTRVEKQ
ncbi:MAG: DUF2147 domain-containing protein [Cryomorphaceae bacterium]|nr:DUF2147 domain-containing protein [Flavobacteriales bacterium]